MVSFGALSFAQPLALAALLLLPSLWLLLRLTPPAPLMARFPPVRFLAKLMRRDESPAKAPLWMLILRLFLAAALIIGFAHPLINATTVLRGQGPLFLIIDDGWAAAVNWRGRQAVIKTLVDQAEREDRAVIAVTTAPSGAPSNEGDGFAKPKIMRAREAGKLLAALQPKPWPTNRKAALESLIAQAFGQPGHVAWLSDGLEEGGAEDFIAPLQTLGTMTVFAEPPDRTAMVLMEPQSEGAALAVFAARAQPGLADVRRLLAFGENGRLLGSAGLVFARDEKTAQARLELPAEMRNRLTRIEIEDENTAAAVILMDERWRRRPVGLVSTAGAGGGKPLLNGLYYIERALAPFAEIRRGKLDELLERELSVLILDDPGRLEEAGLKKLENWIDGGGVVIRFAGPRLARSQGGLLPVKLRLGDRAIGGAMSWSKPVALAPFGEDSPFFGLAVPDDVRIRRQVLAQPAPDLASKIWARLGDGTPLVTAERRGAGLLILVHATASPAWSNLPLSGLFVQMLRRIVGLSQGVEAKSAAAALEPLKTLDGFGRLGAPPAGALSVAPGKLSEAVPGPRHPPGYYGIENQDSVTARRALNLAGSLPLPQLFHSPGVERLSYAASSETDLKPGLLALALLLMVVDLAASLFLRGLLRLRLAAPAVAAMILAGGAVGGSMEAFAAEDDARAATLKTRLAYLITGDARVDEVSRAGLWGLGVVVNRRTTAELGEPLGVNPENDELSFFPLIYWPAAPSGPSLSAKAAANLNAYLLNGGAIVFDARDTDRDFREIAARLDIPALEPLTLNHVLARSFYLLREFPGRLKGGDIWVERAGGRTNDGVSTIIAGRHDWAGAWAMDDALRPLYAVSPGGEKQRETAYRFGVNLVMYALTGNYKADQIHLPSILERLGQ